MPLILSRLAAASAVLCAPPSLASTPWKGTGAETAYPLESPLTVPKELEVQILRLFRVEAWPVGTIATQIGVHHSVVRRVLDQAGVPAAVPPRPSIVDPYVPFIRATWANFPGLPASRLYHMCVERGYAGKPDYFRQRVARYRPQPRGEVFLRLHTIPGEQAQVDWGHFGKLRVGRARRQLLAFVMFLSWSRAIYVRFFLGAHTENFLRGHLGAFQDWGGVPRVLLCDNLKSAVLERKDLAIRFNPLLLDFAARYGFEPRPVGVRRGNEKERVERAIRYLRSSFFLGRRWRDLDDLNAQALDWSHGEAMQRPHAGDSELTVGEALAQERPRLLPLPDDPFPTHERREVRVGKTPYARFDLNDYTVPPEHARRTLTVCATPDEVRLLDGGVEVARHRRSYDKGERVEDPAHLEELIAKKRKARRGRDMDRLTRRVPSCQDFLVELAQRGKNLGNATQRLLILLETYGAEALEAAIQEARTREVIHVSGVCQILEQARVAGTSARAAAAAARRPEDPRAECASARPGGIRRAGWSRRRGG